MKYFIANGFVEVRCHNCRYFVCHASLCRRNAPVAGEGGFAMWPTVLGDSWCGQFEPSQKAKLTAEPLRASASSVVEDSISKGTGPFPPG